MDREPSALERLRALEAQQRAQVVGTLTSEGKPTSARRGAVVGTVAALGFLLWKLKFLFGLLKFGKFATTGFTMLLMAWTYALFYGWPFAVGLVLLILIHELGHGAAARQQGIAVGAPVFIPFFGAFIALKEKPRSTFQDFVIGAGGPIAGTLGGAACLLASLVTEEPTGGLLRALGYFGLIMNLFNLMPVWNLDGDRMMAPVQNRSALVGLAVLGGCLILFTLRAGHVNPIAFFVFAVGAWRVGSRIWSKRAVGGSSALEKVNALARAAAEVPDVSVTPPQRTFATAVYFGLAMLLILAVHELPALLPELPAR